MSVEHPLDRPAWHALRSRQASFAQGTERALRYAPDFGPFGASADDSAESLADLLSLIPEGGSLALMEAEAAIPAGAVVARRAEGVQMVLGRLSPGEPPAGACDLGDADGPQMLLLATLTEPGPFASRTHQLGAFVGIRIGERLVAMAGERMAPPGYTEVSGVCCHPDFRGRGFAGGLMRLVAAGILARGETPFLHAYASNTRAIALYETLGFVVRRRVFLTMLERAPAG